MGWHRRALVVLMAALGASVALPATATATAPTAGACTDGRGITVVVDLSHFGGGIQVRCAPQPVSSGFDALRRAGFEVTGTQRFPGLLCRIDGHPVEQQCVHAPPSGAYWAYWNAPRGGDWTYSTSGAGRRPPEGSVEGWAFGARAEPGIAPPGAVPVTTTTMTPPPPAPPATLSPPATGPAPDGSPPTPVVTTTTTMPAAGAEGSDVATSTTATDAPVDAERADGTAADDADDRDEEGGEDADDEGDAVAVGSTAPPGGDGDGSGSPVAALVTAAALAVVVGGGVVWRRRAASAPGLEHGPG